MGGGGGDSSDGVVVLGPFYSHFQHYGQFLASAAKGWSNLFYIDISHISIGVGSA